MAETLFVGQGHQMLEISETAWKQQLARIPQHSQARLAFMTDAHHRIRNFVVKELVRGQKPLLPESIAATLHMPLEQVTSILEELERRLFFLVRNEQNAVVWAYPVTVEITPHLLHFSTGERLYGA